MKETKQPRVTTSRKDCKCSICGTEIKKGQEIYLEMVGKVVTCMKCYKPVK